MAFPTKKIEDFCRMGSGGTPSRSISEYFDGGTIPWVKSGELKARYVISTEESITDAAVKQSAVKLVPKGALLVAMYGATVGEVSELAMDATTNQAICHVVPDPNVCDRGYLFQYLSAIKPELLDRRVGGGQPNISQTIIKSLSVPLPPLPEQRRIAAILDKADALRAKRREAIAKLDQLLQSVFLEMFGDPVTNPKGWPLGSMSSLTKGKYGIKAGPFGSALKKEFYTSTGYRVYGQEQVIAGTLGTGDYYIDQEKFESLKSCTVSSGDLLISLVGSFGKILVVPNEFEPGIINPRLLKLTPDQDKVSPEFLKHYFQVDSLQKHLKSLSHGGTMGILNAGLIKQLMVPIPPISKQHEFVHILEKLSSQLSDSADSEKRIEALFESLQQSAFSGQTEKGY